MKSIFSILLIAILSTVLTGQKSELIGVGDDFLVRMINDLVMSPDGKSAVFNAVGKIKILELKTNKLKNLTKSEIDFEFEPSFSSDSKKVIFSSWNDNGYGKLHIWDKDTDWKKTILSTAGIIRSASFSSDGNMIVYKKEIEVGKVDSVNQRTEGIYILNLKNGDPIKVSQYGNNPQFSPDGKRIIFQSGTYRLGSFVKTFESVNLTGEDKQILFYGKYGHEYAISVHQQMVAWQELGKIYVATLPEEPVGVSADNLALPIKQVSDMPGNNLSWSIDDSQLSWSIANSMYSINLLKEKSIKLTEINLKREVAKPDGALAFTNVRIITMNNDEIIERGTLVVKENRIIAIGQDLRIPKSAITIDCSGMTILPGLIDMNAASNNYDYNVSPIKQWEYIEFLKAGITTKLEGSFNITEGFTNQELILAEKLIGPRLLNGGVTIAKMDSTLFSDEKSYHHYVQSNLMIANAFAVTAIQSDIALPEANYLVLNNIQADTSLVHPEQLHDSMIQKVDNGGDPYAILKEYTAYHAKMIGVNEHLGSISKGKLADLIILSGNPLEDITKIKSVNFTLINGRIYDTSTMEEIGNYNKSISQKVNTTMYKSLNRTMGSACCGFQH